MAFPVAAPALLGPRTGARRALLAAVLLYVFGLLPVHGATHSHADEPGHGACQLCLLQDQAHAAPAPAEAPLPESIRPLPPLEASPRAVRGLPLPHAPRGPPSA